MNTGMIGKVMLAIGGIILVAVLTADYTGLSHHKGLGKVQKRWLVGSLVTCFAGFVLLKKSKKST